MAHTGRCASRQNSLLDELVTVPNRQLQPVEMYSKLYYETKVQPLVENEMKTAGVLNKGGRLLLIKCLMCEAYEGESDDVKAEVMRQIEERTTPEAEHQPSLGTV